MSDEPLDSSLRVYEADQAPPPGQWCRCAYFRCDQAINLAEAVRTLHDADCPLRNLPASLMAKQAS